MLRRKIVGQAVRQLREHMGAASGTAAISRNWLANIIDQPTGKHTTDAGGVARWERAKILPQAWKRKRLAEIAEENGRKDLASAFGDPIENWRTSLQSSDDRKQKDLARYITLLEIVAINMHFLEVSDLPGESGSGPTYRGGFEIYFETLLAAARELSRLMVSKFGPDHPPILLDDYQRQHWNAIVGDARELEEYRRDSEGRTDDGKENKNAC